MNIQHTFLPICFLFVNNILAAQQSNYNIFSTLQGFKLAKGGHLPYLKNPNIERIRSTIHEFKMMPHKIVWPNVSIHLVSTMTSTKKSSIGLLELHQAGGPSNPFRLELSLTGLSKGRYSIFIHKYGDLSESCKDAGPVYNPFKVFNGGHIVDIIAHENGNIDFLMEKRKIAQHKVSDDDGLVGIFIKGKRLALSGINSILGRAVVIHKDGIDGERVACGVLGRASTNKV